MKHCPDPGCPFAKKHGIASEYRDEVSVCADCGWSLVDGPSPASSSPAAAPVRAESAPWRALLVTIAVAASPLALALVPLPGLDIEAAPFYAREMGVAATFSAFALGIGPLAAAAGVVEVAALAVPRWRPLRHGGPQGRAKLWSATLVVMLGLALVQAWNAALLLESAQVVAYPGVWFRVQTVVTLTAGACVYAAVAQVADRHALVGGYSLLLASRFLEELGRSVRAGLAAASSGQEAASSLAGVILATGALAAASAWILNRRRAPGELRLPACGVVPLYAKASFFALPFVLAGFGLRSFEVFGRWQMIPDLVVTAAMGGALAFSFNRPARLARFAGGVDVARPLARAAVWSVAFVVLLAAVPWVVTAPSMMSAVAIVVCVAVVSDVAGEWRARRASGELVAIWPEHRVYAVDALLAGLTRAGIAGHARGVHHRVLLQFFGPLVPVVICVPKALVEEGARVIEQVLAADTGPAGPYRTRA